ncbi:hypothetical protein [Curtobacterium sp. 458]
MAAVLTLNAVLFPLLLPFGLVGTLSFALLLPGIVGAVGCLAWAGRQGHERVGGAAVVVGLVLLASPLLSFGVWQLAPWLGS